MMGYKKHMEKGIRIVPSQTALAAIALEPTVLDQPTVVVTASKRRQNIEDAPTSVDVIPIRAIADRAVTTLDQVLQNTAGFGIIDGQIDLRGSTGFNWAAGSRVLVLIDGHPLINGDTGGINWDAIPVEEIDHVEVVKGAGSALYGSNAMAGMVNIITRDPSPIPETRFKLRWGFYDEPVYGSWRWTDRFLTTQIGGGRFDLKDALSYEGMDITHSRSFGKVGLLVTAGRNRSSGFQENGFESRWNAMAKTKIRLSPNKNIVVTANWARNNHGDFLQWISQDHPMEVPDNELGNRILNEKGNLHATFQHAVNGRFGYTIKANAYRSRWEDFFTDNRDYAVSDRIGSEAQFDFLIGAQALTAGTEITTNRTQSLMYGNRAMWDAALYVEDAWKPTPLWTVTAGARYDFHRVEGVSNDNQISPRIGVVYQPWTGTNFRLSAGHGFRAPSIAEVFADISLSGFHVVPNLDLKEAERAWSAEAGIRQTFEIRREGEPVSFRSNPFAWAARNLDLSGVLDVTVFGSLYRNMIDVTLNPELMAFQFVNLGRAQNYGVEFRVQAATLGGHLSATAGYTWINPEDLDTGRTLTYRSRHRVVTGIELRFWKITAGFDYRYASRIEEVVGIYSSDQRVPMHVMDGRLVLGLERFQIGLEGKNLANYAYTLRQRLLEPIRSFTVTIRGRI
jgi:outer membrane receptor for ferrienterochelin and colicins